MSTEVVRKYSMVSTVALCLAVGSAAGASMDVYSNALAGGDTKTSALEAMGIMKAKAANVETAEAIMSASEDLMTGAVATGDERVVKWVSAAILKGAGPEYFNAAELGIRVVLEDTRFQPQVAGIVSEARTVMGVPAPVAVAAVEETAVEAPEGAEYEDSLFDINRASWSISNRASIGYDSNYYANSSEKDGMVFRDALSMSLTASSARTSAQIFYKPVLTYAPQKDVGDLEVYQDFIGLVTHELSERTIIRVSDTLRFQEDEDEISTGGSRDNSYWKNKLELGVDRVMSEDARLSVTGSSEVKRYSESDLGQDRDYDLYSIEAAYSRGFDERTFGRVSLSYSDQKYVDSKIKNGSSWIMANAGVNHELNADLVLSAYAGAQFVETDMAAGFEDEDKVVPYFNGQVTYFFTPDTSLNGALVYSYDPDSNRAGSVGSESLRYELGFDHKLTEKISWELTGAISDKAYESDFNAGADDFDVTYTDLRTRVKYAINRTHAVDFGYAFRNTDSDKQSEYDRHQVDAGWTVKF